jgi:putative zinc finger protein
MWQIGHSTGDFRLCRNRIAVAAQSQPQWHRSSCYTRKKSNEVAMTAINKQHARHEIEELLPWYATGTLSGREAERVEQALAGDRELRTRYDLVRRELAETTRLNEALGAPSARAMDKLFAAINAEEARVASMYAASPFLIG